MDFELKAVTKAGERMVELAEEHAADFATRAEQHDRENTFVGENFELMKQSGFLAAAAPEEFGGLGVESVHDITVAISRSARGCGSTAIAANMHVGAVWTVTRTWSRGTARGRTRRRGHRSIPAVPRQVASDHLRRRNRVGQRGVRVPADHGDARRWRLPRQWPQDLRHQLRRRRLGHGVLEGPRRQRLVQLWNGDRAAGQRQGMDVRGNWDALGMRGSGSHDVVFTDCFVPEQMCFPGAPLGDLQCRGVAEPRRQQLLTDRRVPRDRRGGAASSSSRPRRHDARSRSTSGRPTSRRHSSRSPRSSRAGGGTRHARPHRPVARRSTSLRPDCGAHARRHAASDARTGSAPSSS